MKVRSLTTALMICGAVFSASALVADEAPAKAKPQRNASPRGGRDMMRRSGGMMRFDPNMIIAMQVKDELKAYNENKTEENYKKLEEAVKKVSNEMKEKLREQLKKQLENLDKNQAESVEKFLQKAKNGELKMPQRPNRQRPAKRPAKKKD